jgi:uncharacterized spore protein YtfJ
VAVLRSPRDANIRGRCETREVSTMSAGVFEVMERTQDALTVKRVFGEPVERDGITVIPTATIRAGVGGGGGTPNGKSERPEGQGGGFGMNAHPSGVFEIRDGVVTWRPAVDVNKLALGGQIVGVVALLTLRSIVKHQSRAHRTREATEIR